MKLLVLLSLFRALWSLAEQRTEAQNVKVARVVSAEGNVHLTAATEEFFPKAEHSRHGALAHGSLD